MTFFRKISIKNKILLIIMTVVIPILVAQTFITFGRERKLLRKNLETEIITLSKIVADYCSVDLVFKDNDAANSSLNVLKNNEAVLLVEIYDKKNKIFTTKKFSSSFDKSNLEGYPPLNESIFIDDYLVRTEPVYYKEKIIGYIIMYFSTDKLKENIKTIKIVGGSLLIGFLFLTLFVSFFLQRIISEPIIKMTNFINKITKERKYSARLKTAGNDELSILSTGVNEMLHTIEDTTVSKNLVDSMIETLPEGIFLLDSNGFITKSNKAAQLMLEYSEKELVGKNLRNLCDVHFALDSEDSFVELAFKTKQEKEIDTEYYGNQIEENVVVCVLHNISDRKRHETEMKASLKEKEVMIKEIHHRVKNNLQIVSSLLNLQSMAIENKEVQEVFSKSKDRIRSMALIHAKLYKTSDLINIDVLDYVESLAREILMTYNDSKDITLDIVPPNCSFEIDTLVPIGLMLNELITNSVKYAFEGREKGVISIKFYHEVMGGIKMIYEDDGVGLPDDFDIDKTETLGSQLIVIFSEQLNGSVKFVPQLAGAKFVVDFTMENIDA